MLKVSTWADSFGVWHVRLPDDLGVTERLAVASRALQEEIEPREPRADPIVWLFPTRVPELDGPGTRVYRENTLEEEA